MFGMNGKLPTKHTALGILGILIAVMAFSGGCGAQTENSKDGAHDFVKQETEKAADGAVLLIDGDPVSEEEYALLAENHKNDILMQYTTEQVNQPDFWEQEINGKVPYEQLAEIIQDELEDVYSVKHLAVEWKVTDDYSFEDLKDSMNQELDGSADTTDSYGLQNYDVGSYYKYWYSNLETQLVNRMVSDSDAVSVSDSDCKAYYDQQKELFSYDVGVEILYAEFADNRTVQAEQNAQMLAQELQNTDDTEKLTKAFPQATIQKLNLNSVNTQEGMSSMYLNRWNIASGLTEGQIYGPYEDQGAFCVMKCLKRTENGILEYDQVKDQICRYLQLNQVKKVVSEKKEQLDVQAGTCSPKEVIIRALKK